VARPSHGQAGCNPPLRAPLQKPKKKKKKKKKKKLRQREPA
jgi:hypothetical protein